MDEELSDIIDLFNCGGTQKPATLKQAFGEAVNLFLFLSLVIH